MIMLYEGIDKLLFFVGPTQSSVFSVEEALCSGEFLDHC